MNYYEGHNLMLGVGFNAPYFIGQVNNTIDL